MLQCQTTNAPDGLRISFHVSDTYQTSIRIRIYKYSGQTISLVRFSLLILDKVAMGNLNVEYAVDFVILVSPSSPVFDPTIYPPDYNLLSPFASNGGY